MRTEKIVSHWSIGFADSLGKWLFCSCITYTLHIIVYEIESKNESPKNAAYHTMNWSSRSNEDKCLCNTNFRTNAIL